MDGDLQARLYHLADGMVRRGDVFPRAGDAAGARTAGEMDAEIAAARDQGGGVDDVVAVIDALDVEDVDAVADVGRRPAFAGMGGDMEPGGASAVVHFPEGRRRERRFVIVEADADDLVPAAGTHPVSRFD